MSRFRLRGLVGAALALMLGCADSAPPASPALNNSGAPRAEGESCGGEATCAAGLACVEGRCAVEGAANNANNTSTNNSAACEDGRARCGAACCGADEVCGGGRCVLSCGERAECAGACCAQGEVCEGGQCAAPCAGVRCGAALELCCGGEDLCFGGGCVTPGASCARTEECGAGEICEVSVGRCLPRAGLAVCEFRPPVADFEPRLGCRWTPEGLAVTPERRDVVATPVIGNLTDDNADGVTNTDDVPEIAFLTYDLEGDRCCNAMATLRVVDGACRPDGTMRTLASLDFPPMDNSSGLALGDLDGDGVAELVAVGMYGPPNNEGYPRPQGALAWKRASPDGTRWSLLWENMTHPTWNVHTRGGALVSIADLYGDGTPEVIIGNVVLDGQRGTLVWDGLVTSGGTGGIGNNAFLGPYATVADLDLDGAPEIIAGNTVYNRDGTVRWTFDYGEMSSSECDGNLPCDGFSAAANLDGDERGEVVIVRLGEVFVLEDDGALAWRQAIPIDDCMYNESGPPTIADFDGDGRPEIGTAAADFYAVLDRDCDADPVPAGCYGRGVLWASPNQDCSSRVTASSVFDFEGDGKAEMIYADEANLRIYDGTTGAVLFDDDTHGSHTRIEMPVVVDVDNDGNSEIVIPENRSQGGTPGVEVWEDDADNWVRTRRIWNQHAYAVTNVNEDGTIPRYAAPNWLNPRLNNFRQNVQPDGLFDAPDLVVRSLEVDSAGCNLSLEVRVTLVIANEGALGVAPGVPIVVEASDGAMAWPVASLATLTRLLPGQAERFMFSWALPEDAWGKELRLTTSIDAAGTVNECREENNTLTQDAGASFRCMVIE